MFIPTKYPVRFYSHEGRNPNGYRERQRAANRDGAVVYIEHHINSNAGQPGRYGFVIVGRNASRTSKGMAKQYVEFLEGAFYPEIKARRPAVQIGGAGNISIVHTAMPAMLLEPCFGNNPVHADILKSIEGIDKLGDVLVRTITDWFSGGGLVAFSVGHRRLRNKSTSKLDQGCAIHDAPRHPLEDRMMAEADFAEMILQDAACKLMNIRRTER